MKQKVKTKSRRVNYHKELHNLVQFAVSLGFKVHFVKEKLHDYAAMNDEAAKAISYPTKKDVYEIDANLSAESQFKDLKHEMVEDGLMHAGMKYWPAHLKALKAESKPGFEGF
jgi:hypothetical protein